MISEILTNILGYILIGGFVLGLFGGSIYAIICGIREYLEEEDGFCLFVIVMGSIGAMIALILILKALGL